MANLSEEMKEMKKLISSILISNPLSITVNKLDKDYYDMIGERIPYRKFGHRTLESCLRAMPDVLEMQGIGGNALVKVFVSSKVAHIDKLVSNQRLNDKRPRFGRRPRQYHQHQNNFRSNYTPQNYSRRDTYAFSPVDTASSSEINVKTERVTSPSTPVPLLSLKFDPIKISEINRLDAQPDFKKSPNLEIKQNCDKVLVAAENGITFNSRKSSPEIFESDNEDDYSNYKVPRNVQENLKKLISNYSDGIFCSRIPELYKNMFRKELDYNEYGYRCLIQMCQDLKNIFFCYQPDKSDYKIYDVLKPLPLDYAKSLKVSEYTDYENLIHKSQASEDLGLLEDLNSLNLNYEYPLDVVQLYENIPREFIPEEIKKNEYVDVCVGEVYDPSKFWIILRNRMGALQELMDDLQTFYVNCDQKMLIPACIIQVGLYCVAIYSNEFNRAIIVKCNLQDNLVKVFFIDYGTVSIVDATKLYFLHQSFVYLPQQAIRARLASIQPINEQVQWSLKSSNRFLKLVFNKELVAQVYHINFEEQIAEIILIDTIGEEDIFINDTLVTEGHALFSNQIQFKTALDPKCIPCVELIHLYPTFEEIEIGEVPSTADTIKLLNAGLSLNYVYPHYFHTNNKNDKVHENEEEKEVCKPKPNSEPSRSRSRLAKVAKMCNKNVNSPTSYKNDKSSSSTNFKKGVTNAYSSETNVDKLECESLCQEIPSPSSIDTQTVTNTIKEDLLVNYHNITTVDKPLNSLIESPKNFNSTNTNYYEGTTIVKPPPGFPSRTIPVSNFVDVPQPFTPNPFHPYQLQNEMAQFYNLNPPQPNIMIHGEIPNMMQNPQMQQYNPYLNNYILPQINNPQAPIPEATYNCIKNVILKELMKGNSNVYKYIDVLIQQKGNPMQHRTSFDLLQNNYRIIAYDMAQTVFETLFILLTNNQVLELYNIILSQSIRKESIKKSVIQTELNGKSLCLIRYENDVYVLLDEIFVHLKLYIPIARLKKLIVMENPNFCIEDLCLNENITIKEELSKYQNLDSKSVIHLINLQHLPAIINIMDNNDCSMFYNFDKFLNKFHFNSDIWIKS